MNFHTSQHTELFNQVKRLQTSIQMAVFLYEKGSQDFAAILADRVMSKLEKTLDILRSENEETRAYVDMAVRNKLKDFEENRRTIQRLAGELEKSPDGTTEENFHSLLLAISDYTSALRKEVIYVYGSKNPLLDFIVKHKKALWTGLGGLVLVLSALWGIDALLKSRQGLTGFYYKGTRLSELQEIRVDHTIDFTWKRKPPMRGFPSDNFSIRWKGFIDIPESGEYEFFTLSDDGVRLYIDGELVLSNWTRHYPQLDRVTVKLEEGYHPIKMEYFEKHLDATIKLFWRKEFDRDREIIPASQLVPKADYLKEGRTVFEEKAPEDDSEETDSPEGE